MTDFLAGPAIRAWAEDWRETYEQEPLDLARLTGKRVRGISGEAVFEINVVGFSMDVLACVGSSAVIRHSLLSDEGTQIHILQGVVLEEVSTGDA